MSGRFALLVAALVGCSSRGAAPGPDASVTPSPLSTLRTTNAFRDTFRDHLGQGGEVVQSSRGISRKRTRTGGLVRVDPLEVTLPNSADGSTRVSAAFQPGFYVEVQSDEGAAPATIDEGAVVYANARAGVDVVDILEPQRFEEIRLLAQNAPTTFKSTLRLGPAVASLRVNEGRIELLDAAGNIGLSTEPMFAVDAGGVRREVTMRVEGEGAVRTLIVAIDHRGLQHPVALDPTWKASAATVPASSDVELVRIADGRLLYFPGFGTPNAFAFDPKTQTTTSQPSVLYPKGGYSTALLSSGSVLIAGGGTTSELYQPGVGGTALNPVTTSRYYQPLTYVPTPERAYMFGGLAPGGAFYSTADMFEAATATWSPVAPLPVARAYHTQTLVGTSRILIAGGRTSGGDFSSAALYDIPSGSYVPGANMAATRSSHSATRLDDGRVLVAGGFVLFGNPASTAEVYNPMSNTFSAVGAMGYRRYDHSAFKLANGKVLVVGGIGRVGTATTDGILSTTEIFDPASNTWSPGPSLAAPRTDFAGAVVSGGRVVVGAGKPTPGGSTGSIEIFIPDPTACTTSGPGCTCVDGYCCDAPCTGQCEACDVSTYEGICVPVSGEEPHGTRSSCAPFLLCGSGGTCASTCGTDAACAMGSYCATSSCAPKKANGVACGGGNECTSSFCVDGVCCDKPCSGQCEACNVTGSAGTCSNVTGVPVAPRTGCTPGFACSGGSCVTSCTSSSQCAATHYCTSSLCTAKKALGATCSAADQCASSYCVDGYCCNSPCTASCQACDVSTLEGKCSNIPAGAPHGTRTCSPGKLCTASGSCTNSCTVDLDCATGFFCNGSTCVTKRTNGSVCLTNAQCGSGNCVNGSCCDRPCYGECETCRTTPGTCTFRPSTAACGGSGCSGAFLVTPGTCSGTDNACLVGTVTPCPDYLTCANATACRTACSVDTDCTTNKCNTTSGKCELALDAGAPDTGTDTGTDSGAPDSAMPDSAMPDSAIPDSGDDVRPIADAPAPRVAAKPTIPADVQRCTNDSDCQTNHCVEGVCCDTACTDRCYSCALLSNPGKCTAEPIGVDLKGECGAALSCLGTCGGNGECIGAGTGTMCARNRCVTATTGAGAAYCASPGAACNDNEAVSFDCAPYICEPAFGACRTACVGSHECANGFVCEPTSKSCVAASVPAPEEDGCGCSTPGGARGSTGLLASAVVALAIATRRRRI